MFKLLKIPIFCWKELVKQLKIKASFLGNMSAGKGIVRAGSGNKKGKEIVRAGYGNKIDF